MQMQIDPEAIRKGLDAARGRRILLCRRQEALDRMILDTQPPTSPDREWWVPYLRTLAEEAALDLKLIEGQIRDLEEVLRVASSPIAVPGLQPRIGRG